MPILKNHFFPAARRCGSGHREGSACPKGQMLKLEAAQKDYESVEGTAKNVIQIRQNSGGRGPGKLEPEAGCPGRVSRTLRRSEDAHSWHRS